MKKSARMGFTIVEVVLAVAVLLIISGGAVLGFNAVADNAARSQQQNQENQQAWRYTITIDQGNRSTWYNTNSYVSDSGRTTFTDALGKRHDAPTASCHIEEN